MVFSVLTAWVKALVRAWEKSSNTPFAVSAGEAGVAAPEAPATAGSAK